MKFIVSSAQLLKQLSKMSGVIPPNPLVPILENFKFDLKGEQLTIMASDMQTTVQATMEVENSEAESGTIGVPAKILMDTLKNLPEQPITFQVDMDTYSIEILAGKGRYKLAGENPIDFSTFPEVDLDQSVEVAASSVLHAVQNTLFATSTDDLRPAMCGVYCVLGEDQTTFVATDGHRMVRYRRKDLQNSEEKSIILPRKAMNHLKAILPDDPTKTQMVVTDDYAYFAFDAFRMVCNLMDEKYPDYENAIPVNNPYYLHINRMELLNSLKRISIYSNKTTHQIRFRVGGEDLQILAEDIDFSNEAVENVPYDYDGEQMEIGFNARLLIEILNNIEADRLKIELSQPNRAGVIIPDDQEEDEEVLMLIMPVMLSSYAPTNDAG